MTEQPSESVCRHSERTRWNEVDQCWEHGCKLCGNIRHVPVELTGLSRALRQSAPSDDVGRHLA